MGCFGYICKGCGTSIRGNCFTGGEKCILIHVRDGEVLGRCEGHYNEYGTVIEENEETGFRNSNDDINSHSQICDSEFSGNPQSGIVAWHSLCYSKASEKERNDLTPSKGDPSQSWGTVREKFV